jgi:hypothetical protein
MQMKEIKTLKFISVQDTKIDVEVFENLYDGWTGNDVTGQYIGVYTLEHISNYVLDMEEDMEEGLTIDEEWLESVKKVEKEFKDLHKLDKDLHILFDF